jgi:hypothetical protein
MILKSAPRKPLRVLTLVGDSTMTSDLLMILPITSLFVFQISYCGNDGYGQTRRKNHTADDSIRALIASPRASSRLHIPLRAGTSSCPIVPAKQTNRNPIPSKNHVKAEEILLNTDEAFLFFEPVNSHSCPIL